MCPIFYQNLSSCLKIVTLYRQKNVSSEKQKKKKISIIVKPLHSSLRSEPEPSKKNTVALARIIEKLVSKRSELIGSNRNRNVFIARTSPYVIIFLFTNHGVSFFRQIYVGNHILIISHDTGFGLPLADFLHTRSNHDPSSALRSYSSPGEHESKCRFQFNFSPMVINRPIVATMVIS